MHAAICLDVNGTFVIHYFPELIFIDNFLRDVFNANANVFWLFERCQKVKNLNVHSHEFGVSCGNYIIEEGFATNISAVGVATSPG